MLQNTDRLSRILTAAAGLAPAAQLATLGTTGLAVVLPGEAEAAIIKSTIQDLTVPATTSGIYMNVETGVTATSPGSVSGWDSTPGARLACTG